MPKKAHLLVSVINWNNGVATGECLAGIAKIPMEAQPDVYLIDNHSLEEKFSVDTGILEGLRSIKIVYNDTNKGFAGGHNDAISYAIKNHYDYVCLLNNDTEIIDTSVFKKLVSALEENNDAVGASPTILKTLDPPTIWFAGGTMDSNRVLVRHNQVNDVYDDASGNDVERVSFLTGCCLMISLRDKALDVSLCEDYFLYWEDADWCAKMLKNNKKLLYVPDALILHDVSSSLGLFSPQYAYYNVRNMLLFAKTWSTHKTTLLRSIWISTKILGLSLKHPSRTPITLHHLLRALKDGVTGRAGPLQ